MRQVFAVGRGGGQTVRAALLAAVAASVIGCAAPYRTSDIPEARRRPGHAYMLRGFVNVFSTGMGAIADRLLAEGVDAHDCLWLTEGAIVDAAAAHHAAGDRSPVIIGGHSLGADDAIRAAAALADRNVPVTLLVLLDVWEPQPVPRNVTRVLMLNTRAQARVRIAPPRGSWTGTPIIDSVDAGAPSREGLGPVVSEMRHLVIDKDPAVQDRVVAEVLRLCPPRPAGNTRGR